jgi:hypothetical protein
VRKKISTVCVKYADSWPRKIGRKFLKKKNCVTAHAVDSCDCKLLACLWKGRNFAAAVYNVAENIFIKLCMANYI